MGDWLGIVMLAVTLALIFLGYPVAFTLGGAALLFGLIGILTGHVTWPFLGLFSERLSGIMENQILLAVPYFILMGTVLQKSRLAEDLLHTVGLLFGARSGGLALAVVFVGALLAAATGVVGASVVAMGMISLPVMLRYGYDRGLATGTICASGTLGQIIPPSIVLIVLGDQLGVSAGSLFRGALVPGLLLAGLYAAYVAQRAWRSPGCAPALPATERQLSGGRLAARVALVLVPPLALIVVVLGSIFAGLATPTEAGALGALGAFCLSVPRGRLGLTALRETVQETAKLTTMVVFLLVGSTAFTLVFRGLDGDLLIEAGLTSLPGGIIGLLVITNLVVFALGFFIDFFEIAFIVLPLVVPAARALGLDDEQMVWFGVMLAMNLQTSFLTPPFGFSLFYLRSVAPEEVTTPEIYRGVVPFIGIQVVALVLVVVFPELVTGMI